METQNSFFKELVRRRVFYIFAVYLGASFALLEFIDITSDRHAWPSYIWDVVLSMVLAMIPSVWILSWRHGAPGPDRWGKLEKFGVPINVLIAVVLSWNVSQIPTVDILNVKSSEAEASPVPDSNQKTIPAPDLTGHIRILSFFADASSDLIATQNWKGYALASLISNAIQQFPKVSASTLWEGAGNNHFWRLRRNGFPKGLRVPLSLKHDVARLSGHSHFLSLELEDNVDEQVLTAQLYEVGNYQVKQTVSVPFTTVYQVADELALKLNLEQMDSEISMQFRPTEELFTSDLESLELYIQAKMAKVVDENSEQYLAFLEQALIRDPTFSRVHLEYVAYYSEQGQFQEALSHIREALRYDFRLTEKQKFLLRGAMYSIQGDHKRATEVMEQWVASDPQDPDARSQLAMRYIYSGNQIQAAREQIEAALMIDETLISLYPKLAMLATIEGDIEHARKVYEQYMEKDESSFLPHIFLGQLEQNQGKLEAERAHYEQAANKRSDMVTPILSLADLDFREGDLESMENRLLEAEGIQADPRQRALVLRIQLQIAYLRGEYKQAYVYYRNVMPELKSYESSIDLFFNTLVSWSQLYVYAGREQDFLNDIQTAESQLKPPFDQFINAAWIGYHFAKQDFQALDESVESTRAFLKSSNREELSFYLYNSIGWKYLETGQTEDALDSFQSAFKLLNNSFQGFEDNLTRIEVETGLAKAQIASGQFQSGRETLSNILKRWPYQAHANLILAELEWQSQNKDAAKAALDKSLRIWENADENYALLQQALALKDLMEQ